MSVFEYVKNEMTIEEFASFLLDISIEYSTEDGLFNNEVLQYLKDDMKQKFIWEDKERLESVIRELQKEI